MSLSASDRASLASWDAIETRDRLRSREITPREVVEAAIDRARSAGSLGAIVEPTFDAALSEASSLSVSSFSSASPAFAGVPTFIKDLAHVKGVTIRWGSCASNAMVSRRDDPIVTRFRELGFVSLGKSACPELGMTAATECAGQPPCRNPWDTARSPGGSSGGAAALVAAGVVPIAHGSDGGGSLRIPASCCGLVGFKASRFRLDMASSHLLPVNVAVDGVLTRTVRDTVAFFEATEALHRPRKVAPIGRVEQRPTRPLRIGMFVEAPIGTPVDPEVQEAVRAAGRRCEALGHHVEAIGCPFEGQAIDDFLRYWGFVSWVQLALPGPLLHRRFDPSKTEGWTSGLADYFRRNKLETVRAILRLGRLEGIFHDVMARGFDVLLSPVLAEPAPLIGFLATDDFGVHFDRVRAYAPFTAVYNAAGIPAVSVPGARSKAGLPIGVQLAADHGQDRVVLELASALETRPPALAFSPAAR